MPSKLLWENKNPPGGWRYVDPDTGFVYDKGYRSLHALIEHIQDYREQNNLSIIPEISLVVQDWLCGQPNMERYCREYKANQQFKRTISQYASGARAILKATISSLLGEDELSSLEIAEKRALICKTCSHNRPNLKHTRTGKYTDKIISSYVGQRRTSLDEYLWSCEICTCPLRSKVHFSTKLVSTSLSEEEKRKLPDYCWQIKPVERR